MVTGMKKLTVYFYDLFGSGYFLIHEILKMDQKITQAEKVTKVKN